MKPSRVALSGIIAIGIGAAAVAVVRFNGFSTRAEPTMIERTIARVVRRAALPRGARDMRNPVAFSPEVWDESRAHFADHCASCHANDGSGRTALGRNLYPRSPDMRLAETQRLSDGELYWVIENGVRLTGMPAWGDGTDHDLATWKLVHFIRRLPDLTAVELDEMQSMNLRTPAELQEEADDRDFLSGQTDAAPSSTAHHH